MTENRGNGWRLIAGLSGFMAIAMGAVGAHAVTSPYAAALIEKASLYQLIHAALLLWLSPSSNRYSKFARWLFLFGTLFFCCGLYLKATTGWADASRLAPLGGISFMAGWLAITLGYRKP